MEVRDSKTQQLCLQQYSVGLSIIGIYCVLVITKRPGEKALWGIHCRKQKLERCDCCYVDTAEPVLLKGTKNIPVKLFSFSLIQLSNDVRYGCFNFGNNNCQFKEITRTNLLATDKNLLQVDGTTIYATSSQHVKNILWL